ncbi:Origin recognition complex subunit 5 [Dermatophagoides pteronyssinus]|uniref:Origin recognition complex subunit 5 n=1 Tax=Dermatophagoides pteronyssinus TaxID=6956 RepID=A0ABQ8JTH8_DERPT|nr:Origin recognition complex subunit 5 [Dermatophagoides pteronyssinus]
MSTDNNNDDNEKILKIERKFLCRSRQIRKLLHFLKLNQIENLIVNGPKSTGKTSITKTLLNEFDYTYLWFDMINWDNSNRFFFEKILQQFKNHIVKLKNFDNDEDDDEEELSPTKKRKCLNPVQFIDSMIDLLKTYRQLQETLNNNQQQKIILVIDNSDIIVDENNENLIYLLQNINQLTDNIYPIQIIWIIKYRLERLYRLIDFKMNLLEIHFESYNQQELFQLLTQQQSSLLPRNDPHKLYRNFVHLILKTLIPFEDNFLNLNFICHKYFDKYSLPLMNNNEDDDDDNDENIVVQQHNKVGQLFIKFQPYLQEIISQLNGQIIDGWNENIRQSIRSMSLSLCYTYVAVYLATYNSTKMDIRFFVRNQRSTYNKRSRKSFKIKENELKCPKWFELERSYHIYRSLIDLNEKDSSVRSNLLIQQDCEFLKQIANLYDSKILLGKSSTSQWSCSGDSKFQLSQVITDDIIMDISSKIDLDINAFLVHRIERSRF